jgi:hypothetical protein
LEAQFASELDNNAMRNLTMTSPWDFSSNIRGLTIPGPAILLGAEKKGWFEFPIYWAKHWYRLPEEVQHDLLDCL